MKIACLIGRHWPVAAFSPPCEGHEQSHCVDCGVPMFKTCRTDWRVVSGSAPRNANRIPGFGNRAQT